MGEKQGLELILEAASRLQDRGDIQFLLVGEGGAKEGLTAACDSRSLENVLFAPLQPYDLLPNLLASADCHLVVQRTGAADSVLPSKLTNILAVGGNAVITADRSTSLGELTQEWPGIACRVEPESVSALIEGIDNALSMRSPNSIATNYAKYHLDKNVILRKFMANFESRDELRLHFWEDFDD
jgi:colanic acid biosynthesis glycosyl transferase WcaI